MQHCNTHRRNVLGRITFCLVQTESVREGPMAPVATFLHILTYVKHM